MSRPVPRAVWWMAVLFALGSACFAAASVLSQWASVPRPGIGVTFFAGSILFTSAAAVQLHSERDAPSAIQFAGTLFFNVSTFAAMKHGLDARETDLRVWTPDVLGSVCFLVSSAMAWTAARASRIGQLNLLGSIAFGVSALAAFVEPSTDEPVSAAIANAMTTTGALCFLAGAVLLVPDAAEARMSVFVAALVVVVSAALAIGALLLVRRNAPEGSYFADGDRAAGVFGVLATGFAVLLGLVVVLAFTSYDESRAGAEQEAQTVAQQFEVAHLLPPETGRRLGGQLICYARSVVHEEWPRMEDGTQTDAMNPWGVELFRTLRGVEPRTASQQAAYAKWLDQRLDREAARSARIHGAVGVIPAPLWLVLCVIGVVIVAFMMFFADSGERAVVQAAQIGSVVVVMVATLLVIRFLNDPYDPGLGSLRPVAMERALVTLEQQRRIVGDTTPLPCDANGRSRPA